MNKVFLKYYAPVLSRGNKVAFILYCFYDAYKDSEGLVNIKAEKLADFLGLDLEAVENANVVLSSLNLVEIANKKIYCRDVKAPAKESRIQAKGENVLQDAALQEKKVSKLLSVQFMKKLYVKMGPERFRMKHILVELNIDKDFFLEKKKDIRFVKRLKHVVATIKDKEDKTDYYDSLKNSVTAVPIVQWKSPHLLGYFVVQYEKIYKTNFVFSSQNVYNSKEMRDIKRLLSCFDSAEEAKKYIDWFYEEKLNASGLRSVGTGILAYAGMINEYKQKKVKPGIAQKKNGVLGEEFLSWIQSNTPEILERFTLQTIEDLSWVMDAVKENGQDLVIQKVIQEAQRRGILHAAD